MGVWECVVTVFESQLLSQALFGSSLLRRTIASQPRKATVLSYPDLESGQLSVPPCIRLCMAKSFKTDSTGSGSTQSSQLA